MRISRLVTAIVAPAHAAVLASCDGSDEQDVDTSITIVQPGAAEPISDFSFPVEIELTPGVFDPSTVSVTLNDEPLVVTGGPDRFTATVNPGPPLRDANVLIVQAERLGRHWQPAPRVSVPPAQGASLPN